jgi:hypothetical protein
MARKRNRKKKKIPKAHRLTRRVGVAGYENLNQGFYFGWRCEPPHVPPAGCASGVAVRSRLRGFVLALGPRAGGCSWARTRDLSRESESASPVARGRGPPPVTIEPWSLVAGRWSSLGMGDADLLHIVRPIAGGVGGFI